jgi:DNA-binding NarL/FixJ family response regulator
MIRLLLVEDEPLVCQGLRMWLKRVSEVTVVGEATTDAEALLLAHALSPDVVLVDLSQAPVDGIAATAALRAAVAQSAVVVLSLHDDATRRAQAHAAGAYAFVGKQEGVLALLTAIHEAGTRG